MVRRKNTTWSQNTPERICKKGDEADMGIYKIHENTQTKCTSPNKKKPWNTQRTQRGDKKIGWAGNRKHSGETRKYAAPYNAHN